MRVTRSFFGFIALVLLALALSACGVDVNSAPTLTPDMSLPATAAALFPTVVPTVAPTATPVAQGDDSEVIARLLGNMQIAVITRQVDNYRSYVDLSDPTFAQEHNRWLEEWSERGVVLRYDMTIRNLTIAGDEATAELNVGWSTLVDTRVSRGADFPVRFTRVDGQWKFAGEDWTLIEGEGFRVKALPGVEPVGQAVAALLPEVYASVQEMLAYTPQNPVEFKLYDNPWVLVATTRLSISTPLESWHQPGEAVKLVATGVPDESLLARELARFALYDMAGATAGQWPWWVMEGAAEYAASAYWTRTDRNRQVQQVQEWRATTGLVDWNNLSEFSVQRQNFLPQARTQGYVFMRYLSETYGDDGRNAWLRAMAGDDLETATQAAFEISFDDLNTGFLDWLSAQEF